MIFSIVKDLVEKAINSVLNPENGEAEYEGENPDQSLKSSLDLLFEFGKKLFNIKDSSLEGSKFQVPEMHLSNEMYLSLIPMWFSVLAFAFMSLKELGIAMGIVAGLIFISSFFNLIRQEISRTKYLQAKEQNDQIEMEKQALKFRGSIKFVLIQL